MQQATYGWPSARELSALVHRARGEDPAGMEELLSLLRPSLLWFFGRRLSPDAAEDLTQLALVRVGSAIRRIDPERADVYISTVARNLLRTAYRAELKSRAREGQDDPADLMSSDPPVDLRVEYDELLQAVHRTCMGMRPGLREVAEGIVRGDSAAQIAHRLQISPITVRTRLMRVRAIFRSELSGHFEENAIRRRRA